MQLTSYQTLPVSQAAAWEALNDVAMLQASIPGCESLTQTGDNEYEVLLTAAIGPVKAKFKGRLRLSNLTPPVSYDLQFEGQGGAAGHGKGTATVTLEAAGPAETVLHYSATAQVGGKIAQIGSRLVDMAAQKMAGEFFEKFNAALQAQPAKADVAAAGVAAPAPVELALEDAAPTPAEAATEVSPDTMPDPAAALRGVPTPATSAPAKRGFFGWLKRLFGG